MCEPGKAFMVGLAAMLLCGTVSASAQNSDSLAQRIADLTTEWLELNRLANQLDSIEAFVRDANRSARSVDTTTAGHLIVLSHPNVTGVVQPAVHAAWSATRQMLGPSIALIDGTTFRVDFTEMAPSRRRSADDPPATRVRVSTERTAGIATVTANGPSHVGASVRTALVNGIANHLTGLVPAEIAVWAGRIGPVSATYDMRGSYMDLIGNPTTVARECWNRQYHSCRIGLGLQPSDDPLMEWYDDTDRRALVAAITNTPGDLEQRERQVRCLNRTAPEDCVALLRWSDYRETPLKPMHRTHVTLTALRAGGDESFIRLINSSGSIVQRLETAAAMPFDSVLAKWRDDIDAASGTPVRVTLRTGIASVLWIFVFMIAATRSSRWRIG
jgi:hypothetical protein